LVSLRGFIDCAVEGYEAAAKDLKVRLPERPEGVIVQRLELEADEAGRAQHHVVPKASRQTNPMERFHGT
jgi:hypothetical protein